MSAPLGIRDFTVHNGRNKSVLEQDGDELNFMDFIMDIKNITGMQNSTNDEINVSYIRNGNVGSGNICRVTTDNDLMKMWKDMKALSVGKYHLHVSKIVATQSVPSESDGSDDDCMEDTPPPPISPNPSIQTVVHTTPRRSPIPSPPSHASPKVTIVHTTPRRSPRFNATTSPPPISDKLLPAEIDNVLASLHNDLQLDENPYIALGSFGLTIDDFDGDIDRDFSEGEDYNVEDWDHGSDEDWGHGSDNDLVDENLVDANALEDDLELAEFVKKTGNLFEI